MFRSSHPRIRLEQNCEFPFAYYLYPRSVRVSDRTDTPAGDCAHLAVFQDTPANLAQEPFHGHWDDRQLAERTTGMTKLHSGERVEVFQ